MQEKECKPITEKFIEIPYELKDYNNILTYMNNYAPEIFVR